MNKRRQKRDLPSRMILEAKWFNKPALKVAQNLLGKFIIRRIKKRGHRSPKKIAAMITEVEAYTGPEDLASHAAQGKKTKRNKIMFGPPGHWYVYFTYGMHWLLNIVTNKAGHPAAVLIRGVRLYSRHGWQDILGPARVTKALKVDGAFNGMPALPRFGLWIEDRGIRVLRVARRARVGVEYAGSIWSKKPYRFILLDAKFLSKKSS
jgi:DNA-3-methyladenine glycosylase